MPSILSVAQSGLAAAQIGMITTGHNIANASTPGYTRQVVLQGAATGQDTGAGFLGKGTSVLGVMRVFDEYQTSRVNTTTSGSSSLSSYYSQITQVNNLLSDSTTGLAPSLQEFFSGVQTLTTDPNSSASRQSMMSGADQLAATFHSLNDQLSQIRDGVNGQISTSLDTINSQAKQIADLNLAIDSASKGPGSSQAPNDLLDQRDKLVNDMAKMVKVTVVKQNNSYNIFIGNGQPMVVAENVYKLAATVSPTDVSRAEIAYANGKSTVTLAESAITGGSLGGLLDFRAQTLDPTVNSLGRIATTVGMTFNAQHELGQDQTGAIGGQFFNVAGPLTKAATTNLGTGDLAATITSVGALTSSDYSLGFDGNNYNVTRLSDNVNLYSGVTPPAAAIDGITYNLTGAMSAADHFLIRPVALGASGINLAITDRTKIAAASPIRTGTGAQNTGSGVISTGTVNAPAPVDVNLQQPVSITFTSPTTFDVSGTGTGNPVGLTYTPGQDITYNGWTVQISGAAVTGDSFSLGPNTNGVGDSRNALALAALQAAKSMDNGTSSYQSVFGQTVSQVGNKTHELDVTSTAEKALLTQAKAAQQDQSGVNLDEEATNLLRYQQAYAASGKVMATAQKMFDILLSLGQA